jgi:hypothetical protein
LDFNSPGRSDFGLGELLAVKGFIVFDEKAECLNAIERYFLVEAFSKALSQ